MVQFSIIVNFMGQAAVVKNKCYSIVLIFVALELASLVAAVGSRCSQTSSCTAWALQLLLYKRLDVRTCSQHDTHLAWASRTRISTAQEFRSVVFFDCALCG